MCYKDVLDYSEALSYGFLALGLIPSVDHDGKEWKFMGIQSKNKKEWNLTNFANMHRRVTTIALYDTLGPDATKFVVDQTQLTTIACTTDCVGKLCDLKKADGEDGKMKTLHNLITFDESSPEQKALCDEANIKIYTLNEVLEKGKEYKNGEKGTEVGT